MRIFLPLLVCLVPLVGAVELDATCKDQIMKFHTDMKAFLLSRAPKPPEEAGSLPGDKINAVKLCFISAGCTPPDFEAMKSATKKKEDAERKKGEKEEGALEKCMAKEVEKVKATLLKEECIKGLKDKLPEDFSDLLDQDDSMNDEGDDEEMRKDLRKPGRKSRRNGDIRPMKPRPGGPPPPVQMIQKVVHLAQALHLHGDKLNCDEAKRKKVQECLLGLDTTEFNKIKDKVCRPPMAKVFEMAARKRELCDKKKSLYYAISESCRAKMMTLQGDLCECGMKTFDKMRGQMSSSLYACMKANGADFPRGKRIRKLEEGRPFVAGMFCMGPKKLDCPM